MGGSIVVGVEGSDASRAALRWGAEEARLRDARLTAVHVWSFVPPQPMGEPGMLAVPAGDLAGQLSSGQEASESVLRSTVLETLGSTPDREVEERLVEGDAGEVLVELSAEADLVVVGSRGAPGLAAALLGSVSRHVVDHATCPVVVVKAADS